VLPTPALSSRARPGKRDAHECARAADRVPGAAASSDRTQQRRPARSISQALRATGLEDENPATFPSDLNTTRPGRRPSMKASGTSTKGSYRGPW
jgi:hypothetical protein